MYRQHPLFSILPRYILVYSIIWYNIENNDQNHITSPSETFCSSSLPQYKSVKSTCQELSLWLMEKDNVQALSTGTTCAITFTSFRISAAFLENFWAANFMALCSEKSGTRIKWLPILFQNQKWKIIILKVEFSAAVEF